MKEKKSIKISLSTFFLFIAIIVIIAMVYYLYTEKTNYNKEIDDLEKNNANMQDTIDELQEKINSISNTINSDTTSGNNNTENTNNKLSDSEVDKIAADLFEKGSQKIRETEYSEYYEYDRAEPLTDKTINEVTYQKRDVLYSDIEKE